MIGIFESMTRLLIVFFTAMNVISIAQPDRWQQRIIYQMEIDFDANLHQFTGTQKIVYYNNSPETLDKIYYHLYYNAFQYGCTIFKSARS